MAFVRFSHRNDAEEAQASMNNLSLFGRTIKVLSSFCSSSFILSLIRGARTDRRADGMGSGTEHGQGHVRQQNRRGLRQIG